MLGAEACSEDRDRDDGGEVTSPSTWLKMTNSASEAGDATFRSFLDLVIIGKMTGLLQIWSAWSCAGPSTTALGAASADALAERSAAAAAVPAAVAGLQLLLLFRLL